MADIFTDTLSEVKDFSYIRRPTQKQGSLEGLAKAGAALIEGGLEIADRSSLKDFQRKVGEIEEAHRQGMLGFEDSLLKLNAMTRTFVADRPHLAKEARGLASSAIGVDVNEQLAKFELADIEGDISREQRLQTQVQDTLVAAGVDPTTLTEEQQRFHALQLNKASAKLQLLNSTGAKEQRESNTRGAWLENVDASGGAALAGILNRIDLNDPNAIAQARQNLLGLKTQMYVRAGTFAVDQGTPDAVDNLRKDVDVHFEALDNFLNGNLQIKKDALELLQTNLELNLGDSFAAIQLMSQAFGDEGMKELIINLRTKDPKALSTIQGLLGKSFDDTVAKLETAAGRKGTDAQKRNFTYQHTGSYYRGEVDFGQLPAEAKSEVVGTYLGTTRRLQSVPDANITDQTLESWLSQSGVLTKAAATVEGTTDNVRNAMGVFNDPTWHRMFDKTAKKFGDDDERIVQMGREVLSTSANYIQRVGGRNIVRQAERGGAQVVYDPILMQFGLEEVQKSTLEKAIPDISKITSDSADAKQAVKNIDELNKVMRTALRLRRFDPGMSQMTEQQAAQLMAMNAPNIRLRKGRSAISFDVEKAAQSPNYNAEKKGLFPDEVQRAFDNAPVGAMLTAPDGVRYRKTEEGIEEVE